MEGIITAKHPSRPRPLHIALEAGDRARPRTLMEALEWLASHLSETWEIALGLPVALEGCRLELLRGTRRVSVSTASPSANETFSAIAEAIDWLNANLPGGWEIELGLPPVAMEAAPDQPLQVDGTVASIG